MKYILLLSLLLLAGCNNPLSLNSEYQSKSQKMPEMVALQYIGFAERTHRTELKELTGVDPVRTEWCAAFVNAVLSETGIPGSESVSNYPLTARSFLDWGVSVKNPEPGDLVVFPRGNEAWQGHVGFYLRSQVIDGREYYYILGGNQNNRVSIELYRSNRAISIRRYDPAIIAGTY
jgi:uncharacterized protein (TIGR02594 family)